MKSLQAMQGNSCQPNRKPSGSGTETQFRRMGAVVMIGAIFAFSAGCGGGGTVLPQIRHVGEDVVPPPKPDAAKPDAGATTEATGKASAEKASDE